MNVTALAVLSLATWRISSFLVNELGPGELMEQFRAWIGVRYDERSVRYGENVFAELFICVWCMSFWVGIAWSVLYVLAPSATPLLALPWALSAGAIMIEQVTNNG